MKFSNIAGLRDTIVEASYAGEAKTRLDPVQTILLGIMATAYLAFSISLSIAVAAGIETPGLQKLVMGAVFPIGLIAVVIGPAELFTGNAMIPPIAAMTMRVPWSKVLYNWTGSYTGNFIGGIFMAFLLIKGAHLFTGPFYGAEWKSLLIKIVVTKTSLSFQEAFLRGLACVWLVDLAIWLAIRVKEYTAKIFLIWFPTFAFISLGLEHSIVNMYLIPAGILAGAPVTWATFLLNNLLPVTLGNVIGGLFFVGMTYWYSSGAPIFKKKAEGGEELLEAGYDYIVKVVTTTCAITIVFTLLFPLVPGLFTYFLLDKTILSSNQSLSFGEPIIVIAYMLFITILISLRG